KNARTVLGKSVAASFVIEEEKNGVVHTFRVNLTPVLLHAFKGKIMVQAMDITNERRAHEEARRLEQKLVQMEKMESIGHLAGGIAHDFNNQLTSILGYTEILKNTLADNQRAQVFIDSIARAARHSSEITSKLLAFARRDHYQNQTFLFNQLVSETAGGFVLPEGVTLRLALSEYPLYMTGDYTQCRNLTAYLLQNAVESITSEGEITVSTQRAVLSGNDPVCIARSIMPGKYIKLCVCDSGCDIPTDITDKIFSPFYSTKNTSEHAGLGLSAVSGIAAGYNGCVSFAPGEGGGTEFIVYLPESEDPVAGESRRESVTNKDFGTVNAVSSAASRAIILVIDSEKTVLDAILQLLEVVNCRAHGFTKPGTALAYFRNNWKEITAVFADSSGGSRAIHTLCGQIRSINPAVPIEYCTGSPADTAQRAVKENAMFAHLQKPFDVEELEGIISCLDFSPPQRS
ncbi:hypothetical protein KJ966_31665, partial [bacterium]|nr:hypothetical protein [bacterium]